MSDLIFVSVMLAFFLLSWGLVAGYQKLMGR
jgi:hypothetical protein